MGQLAAQAVVLYNLDRQDRMQKNTNVFRGQIFNNNSNFFTCMQLYLYGKLLYSV